MPSRKTKRSRKTSPAVPPKRSKRRGAAKDRVLDEVEKLAGVTRLGMFLESAIEPIVSDKEIVVCFADIRGFTAYCRDLQREMQDRKIQHFLRAYFKIYLEGLYAWLLGAKHEVRGGFGIDSVREFLVPTMFKNLGDGLMLVWEVPPHLSPEAQNDLVHHIVMVVAEIEKRFYFRFRSLTPVEVESYSRAVENLTMGFGIAKGHAWKLDFGRSVDYAGSIINLASRLQDMARPKGVVAHYDVCSWMFDHMVAHGQGTVATVEHLRGYGPEIKIWANSDVTLSAEPIPSLPKLNEPGTSLTE